MTTNAIGLHIAKKNVTKTMERNQAVKLWNDLRNEGWEPDGLNLTKSDPLEGTEYFSFEKQGTKIAVRYIKVEVDE